MDFSGGMMELLFFYIVVQLVNVLVISLQSYNLATSYLEYVKYAQYVQV